MSEAIKFDRSLYSPEAVEAAAAAYGEFAKIELSVDGDATVVAIAPAAGYDPRLLTHAFCNHVLHETIARRREVALQEVK